MSRANVSTNSSSIFRQETSEIEDEKQTSRLAIAALVGGLASILALATPIFWVIPGLAALLAIVALRTIQANSDTMQGRGAAIVGLALACFLGTFGPVRHMTRQHRLYSQSRELATSWIDLVRDGKLREAEQLRHAFHERATADSDLAQHYEKEQNKMMFEAFKMQSPVAELIRWGRDCDVRFVSNEYMQSTGLYDAVAQRFDIVKQHQGREVVVKIELAMRRQFFPAAGEARWQVDDVRAVSVPSNLP